MPGSLTWGYEPTTKKWVPLRVDADGSIHVVGYVDKLNDIGDVDIAVPTDKYVVYWDAGAGKWKQKLILPSKIFDADGDTKVDVEEGPDEDKVRMDVKGVEAFLLHDDGILDLPKQSRARAVRDAIQSIPRTTWTKIQFNSETYDEQGEYDPITNYRFTAKKAGYYAITAVVQMEDMDDGTVLYAGIYKNGALVSQYKGFSPADNQTIQALIADILFLAATNFIEIYCWQGEVAARNITAATEGTWFAIHKLS